MEIVDDYDIEEVIEDKESQRFVNNFEQQQIKFIKKLYSEGHRCIFVHESYPIEISWCNNEKCESSNDYFLRSSV